VQQVIQVQLPTQATLSSAGQLITVEQQDNQPTSGTINAKRVDSHGTSDLIRLTAPLNLTLAARASERWGAGYGAQNTATGQLLPLVGLGRYSFVARDDTAEQGQLTIELDPTQASALFLHDAYSAFHEQLKSELGVDGDNRESLARLSRIDTIVMGGATGSSIVDLTSPDYGMGAITVHAGSSNGSRSVIWCGDGDDTVVGHGADMVIFGGNGRNAYSLSSGRDTLQFASSGTANDRVLAAAGFDPALDRIELWGRSTPAQASSQPATPTPVDPLPYTLTSQSDGMLLRWAGNSVLLEGLMNLPSNGLNISYRF
jgi:Ca2+-binding RTX toxin-like protein